MNFRNNISPTSLPLSFRCQCFILYNKDKLGKFDSKCHSGILLRYSKSSKAYRVEETIHVRINDNKLDTAMSKLDKSFAEMKIENIIKVSLCPTH